MRKAISKHTPGPWTAERVFGRGWEVNAQEGERRVAAVFDGRLAEDGVGEVDYSEINARLIAAVPELLEALKEMLNHDRDKRKAYEAAQAAIAKAEGRS